MVTILVYTASYMPYKTCFIENPSFESDVFDWIVDSLFITDIFVNFITAFEKDDDTNETNLKNIATRYISSWFVFDVISCIPFNLLENALAPSIPTEEEILDGAQRTTTEGAEGAGRADGKSYKI